MATQPEYEMYRSFFTLEEERSKSLMETAKVYLTLITLFFGYLGYKIGDSQFDAFMRLKYGYFPWGLALYGLVFLLILIALTMTVISLFMHDYERVTDPQRFFEKMIQSDATIDERYDLIITNTNGATEVNREQNNRKARNLKMASWSLLVGFVVYGLIFLIAAWLKSKATAT